ncbi:hypothetical protein ACLESO_10220 [Pyxidicoccus sp. 3LG]
MSDFRLTSKLLGALLLSVGALHTAPARAAAPASSPVPVPVPNGSFEIAGGTSGLPAFWTTKGPGKATASSEGKVDAPAASSSRTRRRARRPPSSPKP